MKATLCIYISGPIEPGGAVRGTLLAGGTGHPRFQELRGNLRGLRRNTKRVCLQSTGSERRGWGWGIGALCGGKLRSS